MEKVKLILTIVSIAIVVVPLVVEVFAYANDPASLIIPPQLQNLMNSQNGSNPGGNGSTLPHTSQPSTGPVSLQNLQMPQPAGQIQYDPTTGAFSAPFNFTNPLNTQLSVEQFSAEVVGENNAYLGNVSITPVNVAAGANAIVTVTGTLSQSAVNQLEAQYQSGNLNVSLKDVNLNIGGITVHIDQLNDIGSLLNSTGAPNIPSGTG